MSSSVAAQIIEAMDAQTAALEADVIEGLSAPQKTLPSRWLYDDHGSDLFEQITKLPEYYPTRTETAILNDNAEALAHFCGVEAIVIEYGAGASVKSQILLTALQQPRLYVPIDIAGDFIVASAARLRTRFPALEILPVAADFSQDFDLPSEIPEGFARTGFFPGSTIGNLGVKEAQEFLARVQRHVNGVRPVNVQPGRALIGIDLIKPTSILIPAYDDAAGVTSRFNLNLLSRINRELAGSFNPEEFRHEARWNETESAIEMHIVSASTQTVVAAGKAFDFEEGETIHTESSRKYSLDSFTRIARNAGWRVADTWTDDNDLFAIVGLEVV